MRNTKTADTKATKTTPQTTPQITESTKWKTSTNAAAQVKQRKNKEIQKIKDELAARVGVLEKWRHVLIGCSIVAGFILHKMVNMS